MRELLRDLLVTLTSQERAIANARRATTVLSRARVEREEVHLFLAELESGPDGSAEETEVAAEG